MRIARLLALALLAVAPLGAAAVDAPHEAPGASCVNCHTGHNAPGGALTKVLGNFNLCQSCHLTSTNFGFAWALGDQAAPGSAGRSHRWDAAATNLGATAPNPASADPVEAAMGRRLDAGKLQCSTCHDQHQADVQPVWGTQHVSIAVGTPVAPSPGTGTGTMTVASPAASATAKAYLVEIVGTGSGTTATFRLSNDNGTSWFGCTAPTTYTYVPYAANPCRAGSNVPLNDGANLTVTFAGAANAIVAGDRWKFYLSYPFLRADNTNARMCLTCHRDRDMRWQDAEGGVANGVAGGVLASVTLGTTVFSHPVGQGLNANAKSYDRTGGILDASGILQSSGDGNRTNDLATAAGGAVTCLTCHHPHNADSNSLSVDPR